MVMGEWPRHEVRRLDIGPDAWLEVYRRDDEVGRGPAMSLHTPGELMRFDIFEPHHQHWAVADAPRMLWPSGWAFEQYVALAADSLRHNAALVRKLRGEDPLPDLALAAGWASDELLAAGRREEQRPRTIVLAAGDGTRWADHGGHPKHFITIDGETLLARTVRQFGIDTDVTVVGPDMRYRVGAPVFVPTHDPGHFEADRFTSSARLWSRGERTILVFGDVWLSEEAAEAIRCHREPGVWTWFARFGPSEVTGKTWGEGFALSFWPEHHEAIHAALDRIIALRRQGTLTIAKGWELYRALCGQEDVSLANHQDFGNAVEIDDWTEDFDFPADLDTWLARRGA